MHYRTSKVRDTYVVHTVLGDYGYHLPIRDWKDKIPQDQIISYVHSKFCYDGFRARRTPIIIGQVADTEKFSRVNCWPQGIKIYNCPIKFACSVDYRIPMECSQFDETLAKIVSFEHKINPYITQYYAYLTIEQSLVEANNFQTENKCQVDGLPELYHRYNRPISRTYMVCDIVPDQFFCQEFIVKKNTTSEGILADLGAQAREENAISAEGYSIICYDTYSVYRPSTKDFPFFRTYLKLTFDPYLYKSSEKVIVQNPMFGNI